VVVRGLPISTATATGTTSIASTGTTYTCATRGESSEVHSRVDGDLWCSTFLFLFMNQHGSDVR